MVKSPDGRGDIETAPYINLLIFNSGREELGSYLDTGTRTLERTFTWGKVTSGMERFGEAQGFPSNVMKHSAWIQVGSSGGAVLNEQMQLIGTVPGGSFSLDGKTFRFGVLIPAGEIKICLDVWKQQ